MVQTILKKLASLVGLEGALLVAMIVYVGTAAIPDSVRFFPYAVFTVGLLVSWRFRRSRLLFGLLVLAFADRGILLYVGDVPDPFSAVFQAVAFLVPINIAGIMLMAERGTFTPVGQARLAAVLLQASAVMLLASWTPGWVNGGLHLSPLPDSWFVWSPIAQPALLMFAATFGLLIVRLVLRSNATGRGFLGALIASFLALNTLRGGPVPTIYFSTAGLILIMSVIEASYFMAYRDGLTGLPARRALNEDILRLNGQYTIAMVDVDRFKNFNDRYGHEVGDQVLRKVASQLESVGGGGKAYRYGGEEFALLFPGRDPGEVMSHLERVRISIEDAKFALRGKDRPKERPENPNSNRKPPKKVSVTVSIGAAGRSDHRSAPSEVISFADRALYQAKKAGRNKVKMANGRPRQHTA
ncbi:MAG: GGDEF domain-containing protein [Gemmatimonadetes bacterium]|nr:GGDEF domain-containing protein [Gemmatimonadota bacterium]